MISANRAVAAIGHSRLATSGLKTDDHSHPFTHDHITLVHNGVISNWDDLGADNIKFPVDSAAITYAMATKGEVATLEKLQGSYSLVWYNALTDTINMARNADRPMNFLVDKSGDLIILGSELALLSWIAERNNIDVKATFYTEPGTLVVFKMNDIPNFSVAKFKINWGRPLTWTVHAGITTHPSTITRAEDVALWSKRNKLKPGQSVQFSVTGFMQYHGATVGTLVGCFTKKNRDISVKVSNVPADKFKIGDTLHGTVDSIAIAHTTRGEDVLWCTDARLSRAPGASPTPPVLGNTLHVTKVAKVPDKGLVTKDEFETIVAAGCCLCGGDIKYEDAENILWHHGKPVCAECCLEGESPRKSLN